MNCNGIHDVWMHLKPLLCCLYLAAFLHWMPESYLPPLIVSIYYVHIAPSCLDVWTTLPSHFSKVPLFRIHNRVLRAGRCVSTSLHYYPNLLFMVLHVIECCIVYCWICPHHFIYCPVPSHSSFSTSCTKTLSWFSTWLIVACPHHFIPIHLSTPISCVPGSFQSNRWHGSMPTRHTIQGYQHIRSLRHTPQHRLHAPITSFPSIWTHSFSLLF